MRFYTTQHQFYCGIDLHARLLAICILDPAGAVVLQTQIPADKQLLLQTLAPYRPDVVVAVECLFAWYWVADLCRAEKIPFVLGHALYMKAIHGGKAKNDDIDAEKIGRLLKGGTIPVAYVYPPGLRETRDLLRRRMYLVHQRAALIAHVQIVNAQYNLPEFSKKLMYARNRAELKIAERFTNPQLRKSVEVDLALVDALDAQIADVELHLERTAKVEDPQTFALLKTIGGHKIGNAHLKWAFSEAVCLLVRNYPAVKVWQARRAKKHGKKKTLGILAARLGRTVYHMLRKREAFDVKRFLGQ